jgi:hypothetical protein
MGIGLLLIYAGIGAEWGLVWASGGLFFFVTGICAHLLTLAWVLPGLPGVILRHRVTGVVILITIISLIGITVIIGVLT